MDMFKEYGITKMELFNTIADAIAFIDNHDDGTTENLADRLAEIADVMKELTTDFRK